MKAILDYSTLFIPALLIMKAISDYSTLSIPARLIVSAISDYSTEDKSEAISIIDNNPKNVELEWKIGMTNSG